MQQQRLWYTANDVNQAPLKTYQTKITTDIIFPTEATQLMDWKLGDRISVCIEHNKITLVKNYRGFPLKAQSAHSLRIAIGNIMRDANKTTQNNNFITPGPYIMIVSKDRNNIVLIKNNKEALQKHAGNNQQQSVQFNKLVKNN